MEDKKLKKIGVAAVSASVLTAGTIAFAAAYQSGTAFDPSGSKRDLQTNQVVFSDNDDTVGHKKDADKNESKMLEKNQNQQKQTSAKSKAQADYLFDNEEKLADNSENSAMINNGDNNSTTGNLLDDVAQTPGSKPGTILDITGDASNADVILPGNGGTGTGDGTGTGGNAGGNGNGNAGGNGNNGGSGDGNHGGNGNAGKDDNTGGNKYASVEDPDNVKEKPSSIFGIVKPYPEKSDESKEGLTVQILQGGIGGSYDYLYNGQVIDETRIFNSLTTFAYDEDKQIVYNWDETTLNKYVRIDSVSFDGGVTWIDKFPVTIPLDVDQDGMLIKASYRFSPNEEWKKYTYKSNGEVKESIWYSLKPACIYVMSEKLKEDSKKIDESKVLSKDDKKYVESETLKLFSFTQDLLKANGLADATGIHALVPGWTENDKIVPWIYPVSKGRHILEPLDLVPLSNDYTVKMKDYWMTEYKVDPESFKLGSLQTMTNYEKKSLLGEGRQDYMEVKVPKYVQAVDVDDDADLSVEYLSIPDTVLYINEASKGLTVNRGYIVDENNINYASTDEGVLTNKEGNEYLMIPAKLNEIAVSENVTKVNLAGNNRVETLKIEAESADNFPEVVMDKEETKGQNCKVIVKDNVLNDFVQMYFEQFINKNSSTGLTNFNGIASEEEPDIVYKVSANGFVTGNNHKLRQIIDTGRSVVQLNENINTIQENAFSGAYSVTNLAMPENGDIVKLEKDCLADSSLKTILCYSQKQYNYVINHLEESGASSDVKVEFMKLKMSQEGFGYYEEVNDDTTDYILATTPKNLKIFDGKVTAEDGTAIAITSIADNAFNECDELEWVDLPESVKKIGYEAFYGCSSLQGVMINSTDSIYIGNKAFDKCDDIRFVASNAMTAEMQEGYDPIIEHTYGMTQFTYFYAPTGSTGYGDHAQAFTEESGVTSYSLEDIGDGCKMLYGKNIYDQPWLGIRSGTKVGANVTLPESTLELYSYSMAGLKSSKDEYEINWDDLWTLQYFDEGAFYESDLGGDIVLTQDSSYLESYVFNGCKFTSFQVTGQLTYLGYFVFQDCSNLQTVSLAGANKNVLLPSDLFHGCNELRTLKLNNLVTEYSLSMQTDTPFQFNSAWTQEKEWETLHIEIPDDPEEFYIKKWRYYMAGYRESYSYDGSYTPAYINMWESLYWNYMYKHDFEYPTDEQIDQEVEEKLLAAENGIRKMMGKEAVSEPTNFYPYRKEGNTLTLVGAPSNIDYAFLYGEMMEFPDGWSLDYIASGAFSKSKHLQSLSFVDNLAGIYPDIFKGVESDEITLRFWTDTVPQLIVEKEGTPFSFGVDNSKIKLEVYSGSGEAFIKGWSYPLAGYSDRASMEKAVKAEMTQTNGKEPTDEELKAEVDKRILPYMNIIRGWLGLDSVDTFDAIGSGTDTIASTDQTTPAEPGDTQTPDQTSENGDADISGDNSDKGNTGDASTDENKDNKTDSSKGDKSQSSGNISGDGTSKDQSSTNDSEQDGSVKKDESNSGSQEKGTKEEN